ncbi:helix-turn-helix domain-containing protein [Rugamonas sp. A1-17]|nr:helix-turn-helix domain-containing protein [Rugamonas sp. A1-17]
MQLDQRQMRVYNVSMPSNPTMPAMPPEMPLRKFRLALGLTTSEAGQYAGVSRKTWEAWEAGEVAGKAAPTSAVVLVYSKLERICDADKRNDPSAAAREIVVVLKTVDHVIGYQVPIDSVASDNFMGVEDGTEPGTAVIKSMAVAWGTGRPYAHRTTYVKADNAHVERFAIRHTPL